MNEYWLHVDSTGKEHRFAEAPTWSGTPTHHVIVIGDYEYVDNIMIGDRGHWGPRIAVRPHGQGWEVDDPSENSDHDTRWRRRRTVPMK
jgi:hypothetical protein